MTKSDNEKKAEKSAATGQPVPADKTKAELDVKAEKAALDLQAEVERLRAQILGQEKELALVRADLKDVTDRAAKLTKLIPAKETKVERFRGTLKDAAEEHFQKRNSQWDCLTVIYDTEA